jgi:hypothetical protein
VQELRRGRHCSGLREFRAIVVGFSENGEDNIGGADSLEAWEKDRRNS